jgi:glyceraldehyde-3-phosphate dehydrogenase/erythrose-4-phosphate dehydrogenase
MQHLASLYHDSPPYTTDQSLDGESQRKLRRSRAMAQSILTTTIGVAKALTNIFNDVSHGVGL